MQGPEARFPITRGAGIISGIYGKEAELPSR